MADKSSFTADEWGVLRDAPHLVSVAVASSGASGIIGTVKEAFSSSAALVEGMKSDTPLLRALCAREEISEAQQALRSSLAQLQGADFAAAREKIGTLALERVRAAKAILERKAPSDTAAFVGFVKGLGERVANAAKEGGILGFGGERVSEGEKRMLASLTAVLESTRALDPAPPKPLTATSAAGTTPRAGVSPVPRGYEGATPYLSIRGAAEAIEFYKRAFGATELMRMVAPNGQVGHAEIRIGDTAIVMLADEFPEMGFRGPQSLGGTPVLLMVYVPDVDAFAKRAEEAGAKILRPPADQFYGDRSVTLSDPFGHTWTFATHVEDVPPDEMKRRADAAMKQQT